MSRIHHSITSAALLAFLAAGTLTGCASSDNLVGPDPNDVVLNLERAAEPCPTWEEACDQGVREVCSECPPDSVWRNHGQYNSCRKKAVRRYLEPLSDCFSVDELGTLRECILDEIAEPVEDREVNRKYKFRKE